MTEEWLEPWWRIDDERLQHALGEELHRELTQRHPLYGLRTRVIAKRNDQDDVLVALEDGRIAEVHLTWSRKPEVDPRWPETEIFNSLDAWRAQRMRPAHQEWTAS
jgi:hypothetical protein